eukprot:EC097189.1.p1 GENE.EC097189.1~~EC097189.1.p1  ORF type:complete len:112 (-),score=0.22 EC097189.1:231-566(-)
MLSITKERGKAYSLNIFHQQFNFRQDFFFHYLMRELFNFLSDAEVFSITDWCQKPWQPQLKLITKAFQFSSPVASIPSLMRKQLQFKCEARTSSLFTNAAKPMLSQQKLYI